MEVAQTKAPMAAMTGQTARFSCAIQDQQVADAKLGQTTAAASPAGPAPNDDV